MTRLIAAGELISRPLDAVKELVENALDAGATRLELDLYDAGFQSIVLRDNGVGIPAESVLLAAQRHATSKLEPTPQGMNQIQTLGFRGEALWAMAQAGELTVITRPADQLGACQLRSFLAENHVSKWAAPAGTTVTLEHLFAHLPARRHAQVTAATEVREIIALIGRYILHYPDKHWKVRVDEEPKLLHAPSHFRGGVATVYGALSANRLLEIETNELSGVISRPELSRARRDRMHFAINGRPVALPELERAVLAAYGTLLPAGQAPLVILNLTVPPKDHNPNIHPNKQAVALAQLPYWTEKITEAVQQTLSNTPLMRVSPLPEVPREPTSDDPHRHAQLPELQFIGVYTELYVMAQGAGDLWIVDAHAAHERVIFEQLQADIANQPPLVLAIPELIQLTPEQAATIAEHSSAWQQWGLVLEDFGVGLARLRSVPAGLTLPPRQFLEMALHTPDLRSILARMACLPAYRAGTIDDTRAQQILLALSRCIQPWTCPHGRPTILRLSERELMHRFGRRSIRDVQH